MKTLKYIVPILLMVTLSRTSCNKEDDDKVVPTAVTLTQVEKGGLFLMREEEKLARDVYLYSFDPYAEKIFQNISNSEQKHMDKILELLVVYNIPDPA